jgi:hypothetical protein
MIKKGDCMPYVTASMVIDCASVLYQAMAPRKSQTTRFEGLSLRSQERYLSTARAAIIAAGDKTTFERMSDDRIDRVAEELYRQLDLDSYETTPFANRPDGSKRKYRQYARLVLEVSGV